MTVRRITVACIAALLLAGCASSRPPAAQDTEDTEDTQEGIRRSGGPSWFFFAPDTGQTQSKVAARHYE
jgi:PBP1b-binding outer membrane lipoprotein LpoB